VIDLSKVLFCEVVTLVHHCKLDEALLWTAIQRLPKEPYVRCDFVLASLSGYDCDQLGIPEPPHGRHFDTPDLVRKQFARLDRTSTELEEREKYYVAQAEGTQDDYARWKPLLYRAMEPFAAELYLALHKGLLPARGKLLPAGFSIEDYLHSRHTYEKDDPRLDELSDQPIPSAAWNQPGIDWLSSALTSASDRYCDISIPTDVLLSIYPPQRSELGEAYVVGDTLMIELATCPEIVERPGRGPGRPTPFGNGAWNGFHVEVARLLTRGELPAKREAGIELMTNWFTRTCGQAPGRTAIGERLTPYYRALGIGANSDGN
jgi:hypothetical protein